MSDHTGSLRDRLVDEQAECADATAPKTACAGNDRWRPRIARIQSALDVFLKPPSDETSTPPALVALAAASELAESAEDLRDLLLLAARESGATWVEIGELLGMTPQGAQYRASIVQAALCSGTSNNEADRNHG